MERTAHKMTEQCYYIGIDMDDRNAVISYYKAGMREPETLSTIAGSEIYQIPVVVNCLPNSGRFSN